VRDTLKSLLSARLIGLFTMLAVVGVVVGIRALAQGSYVVGVAILAVVVVYAVGVCSLAATRIRGRSR
jgi:hypothetical protein